MNREATNSEAVREPRPGGAGEGDGAVSDKPRQFRLDALLAGVTLVAALFAWVRTWESATRSMMVWLSAMLAAWALPVVIARGLCRLRWFRERSYLWTVVVSQCWFPAGVLTFIAAWGPFDDWDDAAAAIYFVMTNLAITGITAAFVGWFVDGCFFDRDEDRQAQWIGAIATPLIIVVVTAANVGPPDLLFAGLVGAIVGLFSTGFFIPFGMIFAMRAMDLRKGAESVKPPPTNGDESLPAGDRSTVSATEGASP